MRRLLYNFQLVNADFNNSEAKMAMVIENGIIVWIGKKSKVSKKEKFKTELDLKNTKIFPSFIECHTHAVFAGSRADEFELRNNGVSYLEIAQRGGGILSTMNKTRKASVADLLLKSKKFIDNYLVQGVSTVEVKSGYALDLKNEIKSLEVANQLAGLYGKGKAPRIVPTFLGAHAKPPEFESYSEYLNFLVEKVLPVIKRKKLSRRVDIFYRKNFFEAKESRQYLEKAKSMGFNLVVHANQLTLSGGAELALYLQAQSADHVIHLDEDTIRQFARSSTVAVLLPAADLYMKCPYPPARKLIDAGATVALATDFNPGSCPTQDLSLVGLLARLEMKMTLPEVFKAYTIGAAKALGLEREEGTLEIGKRANFISTYADITDFFYSVGAMPEHQLFIGGNKV